MKSATRHRQMLVQRFRHKADRLVTGARKLLLLVARSLSPGAVHEKCKAASGQKTLVLLCEHEEVIVKSIRSLASM